MKRSILFMSAILSSSLLLSACGRNIRTAYDATPGNFRETELDWKYGANDIKIQTTKLTRQLMDRWLVLTKYDVAKCGKPSITITQVENRTDTYISLDMIRDIFEGVAVRDGRFTITVGDAPNEMELDRLMCKFQNSQKYNRLTVPKAGLATAPHFLAKIRLTKAVNHTRYDDIEDYRMTITLYDIETQEVIDQAFDVLHKRVRLK